MTLLGRDCTALLAAMALFGQLGISSGARDQSAEISGRITDRMQSVIPGATVTVRALDDLAPPRTLTTGSDGRFRAVGVRPGRYRVVVSLQGFKTIIRDDVAATSGTPPEMNEILDVATICECVTIVYPPGSPRPPPPGRLEVKVTDRSGFDLPMAAISITGPTWNWMTGPGEETWGVVTDVKGEHANGDALPGEYTVTVAFPRFRPTTRAGVRVRSGETTTLEFRLDILPASPARTSGAKVFSPRSAPEAPTATQATVRAIGRQPAAKVVEPAPARSDNHIRSARRTGDEGA